MSGKPLTFPLIRGYPSYPRFNNGIAPDRPARFTHAVTGANPYDVLGLERDCTPDQIQAAYRWLARQFHPDLNPGNPCAVERTQELNAAYAVLSSPARRQDLDTSLDRASQPAVPPARGGQNPPIRQDVAVRPADLIRGVSLEILIQDPSNPQGPERLKLVVPPATAPGTRLRLPRPGVDGGIVEIRLKAQGDSKLQVRGSDLRCDLRISLSRAEQGGSERVTGATGSTHFVTIPARVKRGQILRLTGEGLPRSQGGRGDLLVRVQYQPKVQIRRMPPGS